MTKKYLIMNYLQRQLERTGQSPKQLSLELGYRYEHMVDGWLKGRSRPTPLQFREIADFLELDLVELAVGYLIDLAPDLEDVMWAEVLGPRGSSFPKTTDEGLRGPEPSLL